MLEIRTTAPEEYRAASTTVSTALLFPPMDDAAWEKSQPSWAGTAMDSLTAWDGDRCVGHVGGFPVETLVPGGARLATSAVSRVGVLPTHRRQGVASALMDRLLREARDRGQVLASLRASEAGIYGRYGFGIAGDGVEVTVDPVAARPVTGGSGGTMRILAPGEVLDVVRPLYDRCVHTVGAITRPDWMWKRYFGGALEPGGDAEFVAVHTGVDGVDDGFVHYSVKWKEAPSTPPAGVGEIQDLIGASTAVELALWSYICSLDLIRTWAVDERPIDDVARLAFADPRAYQVKRGYDEQWLRLLDVDAALSARVYGDATDGVTIAVSDDRFEANNGVWRVESKGAARHEVDPAAADLATDVATLAATYLGGYRWSLLADLGRTAVRDATALTVADALFVTPRAPFCGSFF